MNVLCLKTQALFRILKIAGVHQPRQRPWSLVMLVWGPLRMISGALRVGLQEIPPASGSETAKARSQDEGSAARTSSEAKGAAGIMRSWML